MTTRFCLVLTLGTVFQISGDAQEPARPVETGQVQWTTDWEGAQQLARAKGRPIALLFQEIPGCQTCQDFGMAVLSHPLLVEAFEDSFVPVLIYNNRGGRDEEILKRFEEPAWNNPVVRYVDDRGKDLIPRVDRIWDPNRTAARMREALLAANQPVPRYLELMAADESTATATFAMHCYWEGEARLGGLAGVSRTRAAWIGPHEVVQVQFDPARIGFTDLLQAAKKMDCASRVYAHDQQQWNVARGDDHLTVEMLAESDPPRDAKTSDQWYYLRRSPAVWLPLTTSQAVKVNAALGLEQDVDAWLSPRQRKLLRQIKMLLQQDEDAMAGFQPLPSDSDLPAYAQALAQRVAGSTGGG